MLSHQLHVGRVGAATSTVLAARCIEHGLTVVSADSDFARFPELVRVEPQSR